MTVTFKFLLTALMLVGSSVSFAVDVCSEIVNPKGGPDSYPFGLEQPVPWISINGTWMLEGSKNNERYIFKTEVTETGAKRLILNVIDARTCETLGSGKAVENSRVVKGILNQGSNSFLMTLHTFRTQDVRECDPDLFLLRPRQSLTILTLANILSPNDRMSMRLIKVREPSCRKL